jgi:periplasmic divalent cation tolerance protein
MGSEIWLVMTTTGNRDEARVLARQAIEGGFAACAQIGVISSIFVWKEALEESEESSILFKVSPGKKDALMNWIREAHSYEVPEILAWTAESGNQDYTDWVGNS